MLNKVTFSMKDIATANSFAEKSAKSHNRHKRDINVVKSDIRIGKLAEIAYFKMIADELSQPNFIISAGDGGYDFIDNNGLKVDVKSHRKSKLVQERVYVNVELMNSDYYELVSINEDECSATYIGKCTKEQAVKNLQYDKANDTYYIRKNNFK